MPHLTTTNYKSTNSKGFNSAIVRSLKRARSAMFGSEFESKRSLLEDHEVSDDGYSDQDFSDDGYSVRDSFEEYPSDEYSEKRGDLRQRPKAPLAVYFLLFVSGLLIFHVLAPRGYFYNHRLGLCSGSVPEIMDIEKPEKPKPPPMNVFEVYPPARVGEDFLPDMVYENLKQECSMVIMEHVFEWSYGKPFVGSYTPPECEWTHVLFNLTMTSEGRQFDRLAMLFLGDVEVFRTSTAEPTWYGIEFNYVKDMTAYSSLLKKNQKVIFDLGNLVNDKYTGSFNTTLTATFYSPPPRSPASAHSPANAVLPISSHNSAQNQPSHYSIPRDRVKENIILPPNTVRATVSISASGNAEEEFWYTNVPSEFTGTFGAENRLLGSSPFREIQLLINGDIVGVAWPFATIYTGGINPGLWRPIVGVAAFDVPEYEIDITPLLPLILGKEGSVFEIKVVGWDPNPLVAEMIGSDWIVSGRVFIWTDSDETWTTTGTIHTQSLPDPNFGFTTILSTDNRGATNSSLELHLTASRSLSITSTIDTSSGPKIVSWTQGLSYSNINILSENGTKQTVTQLTQGTSAGTGTETTTFRWPLSIISSFTVDPEHRNFTIHASIDRSVEESGGMPGVFSRNGGSLYTHQNGSAVFVSGGYARGVTEQRMELVGVPVHGEGVGVYERLVKAEVGKILWDKEVINGRAVEKTMGSECGMEEMVWVGDGRSVRGILGRGPR